MTKEEKSEYFKEYHIKNKEKRSEYAKKWREANKDRKNKKDKEYREANREKIKKYSKEYREKNKDKLKELKKKYWAANSDKFKEYKKKYREENKEKISEQYKKYYKNYKQNPAYKIHCGMAKGIWRNLKSVSLSKNRYTWEELVDYTLEQLMAHLESLFKEGMTWDNYGSYWHIDHIRPKSWFLFESTEDQAFKDCWALSNLQPLEASINCSKGNRYEG